MIKIDIFIPIIKNDEINEINNTIYKKIIEEFKVSKLLVNSFKVLCDGIHIRYDVLEQNNQKLFFKEDLYIDYIFNLYFNNTTNIHKLINKIYKGNKLIHLLNRVKDYYNFHSVELLVNNKYKFKFRKYIEYVEDYNKYLLNLLNEQILEKDIFEMIINLNNINLNQLIIISLLQDLFTDYFKLDIKIKYYEKGIENNYTSLINRSVIAMNINKHILTSKDIKYNFLTQFKTILKEHVINLINNLFDFKNDKIELFTTEIGYDFILGNSEKEYFINIYPLNRKESILISDFLKIHNLLNNNLELLTIL